MQHTCSARDVAVCLTGALRVLQSSITTIRYVHVCQNNTSRYLKARSDCDSALRLDPSHSKSLLRRATANNSLGRHRAALRDLTVALAAAPTNKRLKSELQKTKELHRTSIRKVGGGGVCLVVRTCVGAPG